MKQIVNADDYGMDRNRTEAIRECFRNGVLTTTTLMVNMPYCEQAVRDARKDGFADCIGLHLNLTQGSPLTDRIRRCPLFCNADGNFNARFHHSNWHRLMLGREDKIALADEIRTQMQVYRKLALPMMHLDSHHHSHTDPVVLRVLLPLAKEYGFRSIRLSRNLPQKMGVLKLMYKWHVNRAIHRMGFAHTDYFGPFEDAAREVQSLRSDATLEIMLHPLYSTGVGMPLGCLYDTTDGVLVDSRRDMKDVMMGLKERFGDYKRVTFHDLKRSQCL